MYVRSLCIHPGKAPHMMCIERKGIRASVPNGWQILQDRESQLLQHRNAVCAYGSIHAIPFAGIAPECLQCDRLIRSIGLFKCTFLYEDNWRIYIIW